MYKSFEIKNFKCFEHLKLNNLTRVNLIAGKNNVGKTALLEALFLHCDGHNPERLGDLHDLRRGEMPRIFTDLGVPRRRLPWRADPRFWQTFFRDFETNQPIEITGVEDGHSLRTVTVSLTTDEEARDDAAGELNGGGDLYTGSDTQTVLDLTWSEGEGERGSCRLATRNGALRVLGKLPHHAVLAYRRGARYPLNYLEDARLFSDLARRGGTQSLTDALRNLEPRLDRLEVLVEQNVPTIHGRLGLTQPISLTDMGDGMLRLASLILVFTKTENGVVLVDEIENGLHYSIHEDVWRAIGHAARQFNVQVFATTHSYECIEAAHRAFRGEHQSDFRLFRLERVKGQIRVFDYDPEILETAFESNMEVR